MFVDNAAVEEAVKNLEYMTPWGLGTDWTFADASYVEDDDPGEVFEIGFGLAGKADGRDIITATTPGGKTLFFIGTEEEVLARIATARAKTEASEKSRKSPKKSHIPLRR